MNPLFPRFSLLHQETPVHPLPRFAQKIGVANCWIKRDDLIPVGLGGNKVRKLEFLLGDALAKGCDLVITGGSPQSNHARLTAACAAKAGLETWLCFAGRTQGVFQGNLLLDQLFGAKCFVTGVYGSEALLKEMNRLAEEAKHQGRNPYVIPVGGSTPVGDYGYVIAWQEWERQQSEYQLPPIDEIYLAVGTGGTLAGLIVGQALSATQHSRLIGISVWLSREEATNEVKRFSFELFHKLGKREEISWDKVEIFDQYIGKKYGVPSKEGLEAIRLLAQTEGILVDPIYTGKALAGLIDQAKQRDLRDKHILFWHTGGTPAVFTHASSFEQR